MRVCETSLKKGYYMSLAFDFLEWPAKSVTLSLLQATDNVETPEDGLK